MMICMARRLLKTVMCKWARQEQERLWAGEMFAVGVSRAEISQATIGCLRGIPGFLPAARPHQHIGYGHRTFPIDDHG